MRKVMQQSSISTSAEQDVGSVADTSTEFYTLAERKTAELVIAFVAPVGSGATTCAALIKNDLENFYRYRVDIVKISDLIKDHLKDEVADDDEKRIEKLQQAGNKLRQLSGNAALAMLAVDKINEGREQKTPTADRRHCTIIDSLKHPEEVGVLREIYGSAFWLVGVFAPEDIRISRIEQDGRNKSYLEKIKSTDFDEGLEYGQSVRKTMTLADIFFRNDQDNTETIKISTARFLSMVFGAEVNTPNLDEIAMHNAAGVSFGSACLSRQVGAVIANEEGEIIGRGANDVPKFGGGTYNSGDGSSDHRCYKWRTGECWNDHHKKRIINQISGAAYIGVDKGEVEKKISKTDLRNLIEFSRAVHAEMEAIISVGRHGGKGLVGSTLYTTTFPCHNCARHIVVSGIKRVVYIEPYPKSLALTLHSDAIATIANVVNKVAFLQFEGVAPASFNRVFGMFAERKSNGRVLVIDKAVARPVAAPPLDSLDERELMVIKQVLAKTGISDDGKKARPRTAIPKVTLVADNDDGMLALF